MTSPNDAYTDWTVLQDQDRTGTLEGLERFLSDDTALNVIHYTGSDEWHWMVRVPIADDYTTHEIYASYDEGAYCASIGDAFDALMSWLDEKMPAYAREIENLSCHASGNRRETAKLNFLQRAAIFGFAVVLSASAMAGTIDEAYATDFNLLDAGVQQDIVQQVSEGTSYIMESDTDLSTYYVVSNASQTDAEALVQQACSHIGIGGEIVHAGKSACYLSGDGIAVELPGGDVAMIRDDALTDAVVSQMESLNTDCIELDHYEALQADMQEAIMAFVDGEQQTGSSIFGVKASSLSRFIDIASLPVVLTSVDPVVWATVLLPTAGMAFLAGRLGTLVKPEHEELPAAEPENEQYKRALDTPEMIAQREDAVNVFKASWSKKGCGSYAKAGFDAIEGDDKKNKMFRSILDKRFEPGTLTWIRFDDAAEGAHKTIIDNCTKLANNIGLFDDDAYTSLIRARRKATFRPTPPEVLKSQEERMAFFEGKLAEMAEICERNSSLLVEFDRLISELNSIDDAKSENRTNFLIEEIHRLASEAKYYGDAVVGGV